MISGLFDCTIVHDRLSPRRYRFEYRIFMLSVDLDELPTLNSRLHFFSANDQNLLSLHEKDYLPAAPGAASPVSLKARVTAFLAAEGISAPQRVTLITLPRMLGYAFNPVSFYFCFDRAGAPLAAIAEVTNTFGEMKPFLLGPTCLDATSQAPTFRLRVPKYFYVSPFSDVDVEFEFRLPVPSPDLRIRIDDVVKGERTLLSRLQGTRKPLTDWHLLWYLTTFPLMTLAVIGRIHWHALKLWLKGLPWYAKAARPEDQRALFRPHASLTSHKA